MYLDLNSINNYERLNREDFESITCLVWRIKDVEIPPLPPYLESFDCEGMNIKTLPELPCTLKYLYLSKNYLVILPSLPTNLLYLHCDDNHLISLPELPRNLRVLYCDKNRLIYLPPLPMSISEIDFSNNYISTFPNLYHNYLEFLGYHHNLFFIPHKISYGPSSYYQTVYPNRNKFCFVLKLQKRWKRLIKRRKLERLKEALKDTDLEKGMNGFMDNFILSLLEFV